MSIALFAFSGIRLTELERLSSEHIRAGEVIHIRPEAKRPGGRIIPILPVLDAWLQPFYGNRGSMIRSRNILMRIRNLGREQNVPIPRAGFRYSYCAHRLALVCNLDQVATESGRSAFLGRRQFISRVGASDAREFFSVTPEKVGIKDWPKMVTKCLKRS